jgi:heme exporter protein A
MRLVCERLEARRGERRIFGGLSFVVEAGHALVVTGVNGSGKSTLLKVIAGFIPAAGGTIRLEGGDPEKRLGEHCHFLAHANALKPQLTVLENLSFWQGFLGEGLSPEDALREVGLGGIGDIPAGYLSAGQKRRVAIARLLVSHRPIWLLDEPTAALDSASDRRFAEIVARHLDGGGIAIAATHQPLGLTKAAILDMREHVAGASA